MSELLQDYIHDKFYIFSEGVNIAYNTKWAILSYIMARTSYIELDDDVCFVLDQHAKFDFYSASSLKQL